MRASGIVECLRAPGVTDARVSRGWSWVFESNSWMYTRHEVIAQYIKPMEKETWKYIRKKHREGIDSIWCPPDLEGPQ